MKLKKVLVTGAAGFIGSHLVECLTEKGYKVRAFIRYNSKNDWGWLENSPSLKHLEIMTGDIRDFDSVSRAMKGCDTVLHLAALIGIPYSYDAPLSYIKTNVEGTYNVLECARAFEFENIIIASTSETYGTAQFVPMSENHPQAAQSPYAASKIAADQLALSYYHSFNLPVKIVRPFNTYGPRQSLRAVIPTIITKIITGHKIIEVGNLTPTRDFTYVADTVEAFTTILETSHFIGCVTNIGSNREIAIRELAYKIGKICNVEIELME